MSFLLVSNDGTGAAAPALNPHYVREQSTTDVCQPWLFSVHPFSRTPPARTFFSLKLADASVSPSSNHPQVEHGSRGEEGTISHENRGNEGACHLVNPSLSVRYEWRSSIVLPEF